MFGIHIGHFASDDVLHSHTAAFEDVPHGAVEQYALGVVARKGLGNIETTHAAKLLLLLKEEELVGLHVELATDAAVVINDEVGDAEGVQLLAASQSCGAGTDDCYLGLVDFHLALLGFLGLGEDMDTAVHMAHLFHSIDKGDANASHLPVDNHFTGAALADAAVKTAVAAVDAVAVHGEPGLVESGGNGVALAALHLLSVIKKFNNLALRDVQNRVCFDSVHRIRFL